MKKLSGPQPPGFDEAKCENATKEVQIACDDLLDSALFGTPAIGRIADAFADMQDKQDKEKSDLWENPLLWGAIGAAAVAGLTAAMGGGDDGGDSSDAGGTTAAESLSPSSDTGSTTTGSSTGDSTPTIKTEQVPESIQQPARTVIPTGSPSNEGGGGDSEVFVAATEALQDPDDLSSDGSDDTSDTSGGVTGGTLGGATGDTTGDGGGRETESVGNGGSTAGEGESGTVPGGVNIENGLSGSRGIAYDPLLESEGQSTAGANQGSGSGMINGAPPQRRSVSSGATQRKFGTSTAAARGATTQSTSSGKATGSSTIPPQASFPTALPSVLSPEEILKRQNEIKTELRQRGLLSK